MLTDKLRRSSSEIPTSSMADIAFLLLIFFLVTTTINTDKGLEQVLPASDETIEVSKKNITNLLINAMGKVLLDEKPVEINQISKIIKQKLAGNPKLIVSVKPHPRTKYEVYIQVLDQLKQANATRVSIAD